MCSRDYGSISRLATKKNRRRKQQDCLRLYQAAKVFLEGVQRNVYGSEGRQVEGRSKVTG
jgi:hypothetical protein